MVADLLNENSQAWNQPLIQQLFEDNIANEILAIPLMDTDLESLNSTEDQSLSLEHLSKRYSNEGEFVRVHWSGSLADLEGSEFLDLQSKKPPIRRYP